MFKVNIDPPINNYISETVEIKLVEIPVSYMDNRDGKEYQSVFFFPLSHDDERCGDEKCGAIKCVNEICRVLGLTYCGTTGDMNVKTLSFDAASEFLRLEVPQKG